MSRKDLTGQRFGRLLVLEYSHSASGNTHWHCLCDCGIKKIISGTALYGGRAKSCGCLKREVTIARSTRHGMATRQGRTPTYNSWRRMIVYCTNPKHPRWPGWGGRGITVCERWQGWFGYPNFLADMGEKPAGTTLERINNDGNYEPANCRWATPAEQARNKRNTKLTPEKILEIISYAEMPTGEIASRVGIDRHVVGIVLFTARTLQQQMPPKR